MNEIGVEVLVVLIHIWLPVNLAVGTAGLGLECKAYRLGLCSPKTETPKP